MKYDKIPTTNKGAGKTYPKLPVAIPHKAKVEVVNLPTQEKVIFPEKQKVEVLNPTPVVFPNIQKVIVENPTKPVEVQKVEVINPTPQKDITFPTIQKVLVTNPQPIPEFKLPDIQKVQVTNPVEKLDIPIGLGNVPGKANPEKYVPVRLTDGKKFYKALEDAYVAASATGNKLLSGQAKTQITDDKGNVVDTSTHGGDVYLLTDHKDLTISGIMTGLGGSIELETHGVGSALVQVGGTWQGKIDIQGAIDSIWNTLSIFQPTGLLIRTGINNDAQNGLYRVVIAAGYTKLRAVFTTYTSGSATIQWNASAPVGSMQVWQLNANNLMAQVSQPTGTNLHAVLDGVTTVSGTQAIADPTTHLAVSVEARKQTPTGNAMNVQIGPGDVISNIPVILDFEHHQVHEGESYLAQDVQLSIGAATVKYGLTVPVFANTIQGPHLIIFADVFNGNALVQMYEVATFTGGTPITTYNRNRNAATTPGTTIKTGVTSTNGTLLKSFFAGGGKTSSASSRAESEMVLKSNTIYRIDVIGQAAGTQAIIGFEWYEDLGV